LRKKAAELKTMEPCPKLCPPCIIW